MQDPANRRALRLSLTCAGEELLATCEIEMHAIEAKMFEQMSTREAEALKSRLQTLHDGLGLKLDG